MGTGSSKNNNVVAFDVEDVPTAKKENDQNGNKPSSWQEDVKKEQKSRSRLGVRYIYKLFHLSKIDTNLKSLKNCYVKSIEKGAGMQFVNCTVNTIGVQLTQITK